MPPSRGPQYRGDCTVRTPNYELVRLMTVLAPCSVCPSQLRSASGRLRLPTESEPLVEDGNAEAVPKHLFLLCEPVPRVQDFDLLRRGFEVGTADH